MEDEDVAVAVESSMADDGSSQALNRASERRRRK